MIGQDSRSTWWIGERARTGLGGERVDKRLPAQQPLEHLDEKSHLHWAVVPYIIDSVARRVICRGGVEEELHDRGHGVVDVGEVAERPALVEKREPFARQDRTRKDDRRHIRPAPRAIDREQAHAGRAHPEKMAVGGGH
jgi:hypothetical protein